MPLRISTLSLVILLAGCSSPRQPPAADQVLPVSENPEALARISYGPPQEPARLEVLNPPPEARPGPRPDSPSSMNFEAGYRELIAQGIIHSVDIESHRVRMEPAFWDGLTLEAKQNSVLVWAAYFKSKTGGGIWVDIMSSRNDEKLATFSAWGGVKIIR